MGRNAKFLFAEQQFSISPEDPLWIPTACQQLHRKEWPLKHGN